MKIIGIIPSRYASSRLPAKALAELEGKTLVQRVYEQASQCKTLDKVVIATDHEEIFKHVQSFGGEVCMTSVHHQSGTDRCYEALRNEKEEYDYVINIQGDEPFIEPQMIDTLAQSLEDNAELATMAKKITKEEQLFDPSVVKVIFGKEMKAIYFSRATLPFVRNAPKEEWMQKRDFYKHIGLYAYRTDILKAVTSLEPSGLELAESLEQLRWVENGYAIKVAITEHECLGIDTPQDLQRAREILRNK